MIDSLKASHNDYVKWDGSVLGLGIRVRPSGRKTFICKYRTVQGRQRKSTLGAYGAITLDDARKLAKKTVAAAAMGDDPAAKKNEERKAVTFAHFTERYLNEHAQLRKTARSYGEDKRIIKKSLIPEFGNTKLNAITKNDVAKFHSKMGSTPYTANRTLALLSKMMNLAEDWGIKPENSNPCSRIKKFKEHKRERFLTPAEIARLWSMLDENLKDGLETVSTCNAIKLLILTGCRKSEILTLRWDQVKDGYFDFPHTKTGPQRRRFSSATRNFLGTIDRVADNPYVIFGKLEGSHLVNLKSSWLRIRKRAGLENVRIHDLRHTFASVAASNGVPLRTIGELLGHRDIQSTFRYAHLTDFAVKEAADLVGQNLLINIENENDNKKMAI